MSTKKNVSDSDTTKAAAEAEEISAAKSVTKSAESVTETAENVTETAESITEAGESETKATPPVKYAGVKNFVYMGPPMPGRGLKSLGVLIGTYEQIIEHYKDTFELYPEAKQLIVPVAKLAETRDKIKQGGNLIYSNYQKVTAAIKAKGENK